MAKLFFIPGIIALLLFSCSQDLPTQTIPPTGPIVFSEEKIPLDGNEFIYQQNMGFNWEKNVPISWKIHTLTGELPDGLAADDDGWLWFRKPGTDTSLPLEEPGEHRTIWTSQSNLSFSFSSTDGRIQNLVTRVEARVKEIDGSVTEHASPFKSDRLIGSHITVPFTNGADTSTGIEFILNEVIGDIFVEGLYADHFMFRLNILDSDLQVVSAGEWHSSLESPDLRKVILNDTTDPAITPNDQGTFTQFESYVVSRQGTEEATHQTVYFHAQTGFKPRALIYPQFLAALGQYHYGGMDNNNPSQFYECIPPQNGHFNLHLWEGDYGYEAINSPDFKLHLQWGYHGQYGRIASSGAIIITDDPYDIEMNYCIDHNTDVNYGSRVIAFDLRLDGAPFPALDQFFDPQLVYHTDGTLWLRVQNINANSRHCILEDLSDGNHQFEVCAVDLQNVHSDPATIIVNLVPYVPEDSRSGILVVDDDSNHGNYSPDAVVDAFYANVVPGSWGDVQSFELDFFEDITNVSLVLMQNFRAVIWHSDNPSSNGYLALNHPALEIYLSNQGNLLVSHTSQLAQNLWQLALTAPEFLSNRLGLQGTQDYGILSNSLASNPFFIRAIGLQGIADIDLNHSTSFNPLVNLIQGLSTVTYFNPSSDMDFLYQFGCKPVDHPVYPPTQDQYDLYSSKYVGYKYSQNGATVVLLGFPLSYMEESDVATALQEILGDILDSKYAQGGIK